MNKERFSNRRLAQISSLKELRNTRYKIADRIDILEDKFEHNRLAIFDIEGAMQGIIRKAECIHEAWERVTGIARCLREQSGKCLSNLGEKVKDKVQEAVKSRSKKKAADKASEKAQEKATEKAVTKKEKSKAKAEKPSKNTASKAEAVIPSEEPAIETVNIEKTEPQAENPAQKVADNQTIEVVETIEVSDEQAVAETAATDAEESATDTEKKPRSSRRRRRRKKE